MAKYGLKAEAQLNQIVKWQCDSVASGEEQLMNSAESLISRELMLSSDARKNKHMTADLG